MKKLLLGMTCLFLFNSIVLNAEVLKKGSIIDAGYSEDIYESKVVGLYGKMITLKTKKFIKSGSLNIQRVFNIFVSDIKGVNAVYNDKYPEQDNKDYPKLYKGVYVEALHPNGEWYVGVIIERYGHYFKISMGASGWSPVWVEAKNIVKEFKLVKDIIFKDYRKKQVGVLKKNGKLFNRKNKFIAKIYSNGKVYDPSGEYIGSINPDASIESEGSIKFKAKIKFNNGILYMDPAGKPLFVMRYIYAALYQPKKPERVDIFFNQDELKGHMRICAGLVLLLKDKF
ncbi:MAG: hypothetical protein COA79_21245 [Planctomycetota bacterium]|nr:MAG: hypothetical protein COA79_21245 [Planctomycetota bacterium]